MISVHRENNIFHSLAERAALQRPSASSTAVRTVYFKEVFALLFRVTDPFYPLERCFGRGMLCFPKTRRPRTSRVVAIRLHVAPRCDREGWRIDVRVGQKRE